MATVTLNKTPLHVEGRFPAAGDTVPDFMLVDKELNDVRLNKFAGMRKILNIVPSLDTPVCAESARKFNAAASMLSNTVVLVISADLPFAQARFCGAEGLANVITLSTMRNQDFMQDYGVKITDNPLAGVCACAVIVLDENNRVIYSELVPEIAQEPNYEAALAALR